MRSVGSVVIGPLFWVAPQFGIDHIVSLWGDGKALCGHEFSWEQAEKELSTGHRCMGCGEIYEKLLHPMFKIDGVDG
jgi:hypothetical protein